MLHMLNTTKIDSFGGGLNLVDPPDKLDPSEHQSGTHDVEVTSGGKSFRCRRIINGFATSAALPSANQAPPQDTARITSMSTYRLTPTTNDSVVMSNEAGGIYTLDPNVSNPTFTTVLAPVPSAEWRFLQAQDSGTTEYIWALNGTSTPQKFNIATATLSAWGGTPPNGSFHRVWRNMMIISGVTAQPQRVYFSAIANPESWPANNFIDIKSTDDEADPITAMEVVGENLLIFKQSSVWLVFDPVSFENRRIGEVGCVGRGACCRVEIDRVWFVGVGGVYSTDGDDVKTESKKIQPLWEDTSFTTPGLLHTNRELTRLVPMWDGKILFINYMMGASVGANPVLMADTRLAKPDGQTPWFVMGTAGSKFSFLNCAVRAFYKRHNNSSVINPTQGVIAVFNQLSGAQLAADIFESPPGSNGADDSLNGSFSIPAEYIPGTVELDSSENFCRIRRLNVLSRSPDATAATSTLQVVVEPTDASASFSSAIQVIPTYAVAGKQPTMTRFRPDTRGRLFRLKLRPRSGNEIMSIELKYRGGDEH